MKSGEGKEIWMKGADIEYRILDIECLTGTEWSALGQTTDRRCVSIPIPKICDSRIGWQPSRIPDFRLQTPARLLGGGFIQDYTPG